MSDTLTAVASKIALQMTLRAPRKSNTRNSRPHFVGSMNDGAIRAHVYTPHKLDTLVVKVKDAEVKNLDHGEQRLTWVDEDSNTFVKAFIPLSERGNVKKFKLNF